MQLRPQCQREDKPDPGMKGTRASCKSPSDRQSCTPVLPLK